MKILFVCLFSINIFLYLFSRLLPDLKILQLEEYSVKGLFKYNIKNKPLLFLVDGIFLILCVLYCILKSEIIVLFALLILLIENIVAFKYKRMTPKYTKRIKRIIVIFLLLVFCVAILSLSLNILLFIYLILTIILDIVTITSNYIVKIFECILLRYYINSAIKKINKNDLIKIAIVGSYGKTSVKNILYTILKEKYSVLMTPESYNTPSGLALTINNNDLRKYEVIIMEMGAKKSGDIKTLCKHFKPDYAILTAIGQQHLQTFGSVEEIVKAKGEVLDYVDDCVFNCDNEYVKSIYNNFKGNKISVGEGSEVCCLNKKVTFENSNFDIYYKGKIFGTAYTELIGEHNIENILLAVAMSIKLGLSSRQILCGVRNLKPVKSRMEKIVLESGAVVINNGYNSNPNSAKSSIKLISLFKDKRKIIITPGFVEMGKHQYRLNYELGKLIAQNVDECIIVNKVNSNAIRCGLKDGKFSNFIEVDTFKDVDFSKFNGDDVILIENDLPENYV